MRMESETSNSNYAINVSYFLLIILIFFLDIYMQVNLLLQGDTCWRRNVLSKTFLWCEMLVFLTQRTQVHKFLFL